MDNCADPEILSENNHSWTHSKRPTFGIAVADWACIFDQNKIHDPTVGHVMAKFRLGIIGLGMAVSPHAQALIDLRDTVEVVYAFSPSVSRRAAFAERYDFPVCDSLDVLLQDQTIDAILILTPPNTHLEIVRQCAKAGKHVLLEKPLDVTTARAKALISVCREAGVTLGIVLQHRFKPAATKLADMFAEGDLGDIVSCSTSICLWRPQSYYDEPGRGTLSRDGGGVLITQGIHTLDLMLSFVGSAAEVSGYATTTTLHQMEGEDLVCAGVRFRNGAIGTINATTSAYPGFPERIDFICQNATASLVGNSVDIFWHDGRTFHWKTSENAGGTGADPMAFSHHSHRSVIADFIEAVRHKRSPQVTGDAVLSVHHLIDALLKSSEKNCPVIVAD